MNRSRLWLAIAICTALLMAFAYTSRAKHRWIRAADGFHFITERR